MANNSSKFNVDLEIDSVVQGDAISKTLENVKELQKSLRELNGSSFDGIKNDSSKKLSSQQDFFKNWNFGNKIMELGKSMGGLLIGINSLKDVIKKTYGLFKEAENVNANLIRAGYTTEEAEETRIKVRGIPTASAELLDENIKELLYLTSKKNIFNPKTDQGTAVDMVKTSSLLRDYSPASLKYTGGIESFTEKLAPFKFNLSKMQEILDGVLTFNEETGESFESYMKMIEQYSKFSKGKMSPQKMLSSSVEAIESFGSFEAFSKTFERIVSALETPLGQSLMASMSENGKPFGNFELMMNEYGGDINRMMKNVTSSILNSTRENKFTGKQQIALKDLFLGSLNADRAENFLKSKSRKIEKTPTIRKVADFLGDQSLEVNELKAQHIKRVFGTANTSNKMLTKDQYLRSLQAEELGRPNRPMLQKIKGIENLDSLYNQYKQKIQAKQGLKYIENRKDIEKMLESSSTPKTINDNSIMNNTFNIQGNNSADISKGVSTVLSKFRSDKFELS